MELGCQEVLRTLEDNRATLRRFGVRRLGLFGSAARGQSKRKSDLDFVVELQPKTFDAYMELKTFLEELFGCPVDLVLPEAIKPRLRERIMKETVDVPGL